MIKIFTLKVLVFLLTFILSLIMSGCRAMVQNTSPTEIPEFVRIDQVISASAKLVPSKQATLSFTMGGNEVDIYYQTGDFVEEGKLLAKIDQEDLQFAVDQALINQKRAQLALDQLKKLPTKESIAAAKVALANAEVNFDRLDRAGARQIELDAAQALINSAKVSLETIEAGATEIQLKNAQLELDAANLALKQALFAKTNSEIRMPFDGTVIEVYLKNDEFVTPSQPVFLVADMAEMYIETTDLSEVDAVRLSVGDVATISFDALPDKTFIGIVEKIAYKASPGSAINFSVFINLDEMPSNLRWGMTAFVEFKGD
ncbi:MAG: efflux RND transporter periplasmic adaptor subunit [Anaerolineaceae bacterium]|nr:efflux RND transporter periplasmic adaptor subunit [Anaerolineaceae bacterium]